jgi:hypothetical protein
MCIYIDLEHLYLFITLSFFKVDLLSKLAMCFSRSPKITLLHSMSTATLLPFHEDIDSPAVDERNNMHAP